MGEPIRVSISNGLDSLWVSDNSASDYDYQIELGDWGSIGLSKSELNDLICALVRIKQ